MKTDIIFTQSKYALVLIGALGLAVILTWAKIDESKELEATLRTVESVSRELQARPEYASLAVGPHTAPAIVISGSVSNANDIYRLQKMIESMRLPRRTFATLYVGDANETTEFIRWQVPPAVSGKTKDR